MKPILLVLLSSVVLTVPAGAQGMAPGSDPVLTPEVLEAKNELGPGPVDVGYTIGVPESGSGLCEINIVVSNKTTGQSRTIKTRSYAVDCKDLDVDVGYRDGLQYVKTTLKPKNQPPGGAGPQDPITIEDILKALNSLGGPSSAKPALSSTGFHAAEAQAAQRSANSVPEILDLPLAPPFSQGSDLEALNGCDPVRPPTIYRVNYNANTVTRVGGCTPTLVADIPVGSHPQQAVLTPDGKTLIVTCYDHVITFIDTTTNRVTKSLQTPADFFPTGIDVTRDGLLAYVVSQNAARPGLMVVDIPGQAILARIVLPHQNPNGVFITPDGTQAYITHPQGIEVAIFDLLSNTVAATLTMTEPKAVVFNRTGTQAYISSSRTIRVFDTSTMLQVDSFDFPGEATGMELSEDGHRLFIEDYFSTRQYILELVTRTLRSVDTTLLPPGFTLN